MGGEIGEGGVSSLDDETRCAEDAEADIESTVVDAEDGGVVVLCWFQHGTSDPGRDRR